MMDLQFSKVCFKCNQLKEKTEFYKHAQMADGRLNKCKECTIKDTAKRTEINISTPEGLEKERERHRDKYRRLNYKEAQKIWDKDKPWTNSNIYKGLSKKLNIPKGFEAHHWNYNNDYLLDVILLKIKQHRQSHRFLTLDKDWFIFKDLDGNILNTKEKHISYLISKGILF